MCGNDEMAIGALIALRARRLRVPADVAVTGFDDIAAAHHVRPGLTTVRQPMRELGEQSVRMLIGRISDPPAPRQSVILPTRTVIRRSCGCRPRPPARASLGRHEGPGRHRKRWRGQRQYSEREYTGGRRATGRVVEHGPTKQVLQHPQHGYTIQLLDAVANPFSAASAGSPASDRGN